MSSGPDARGGGGYGSVLWPVVHGGDEEERYQPFDREKAQRRLDGQLVRTTGDFAVTFAAQSERCQHTMTLGYLARIAPYPERGRLIGYN